MLEQVLANNEFFQGGFVLMVLGGAAAAARPLAKMLWRFVQRKMTTTLYVRDERLVSWIDDWIETHRDEIRSRWLQGQVINGQAGPRVLLGPGNGLHLFRRGGKRFSLWSHLEENGVAGKIHTVTLQCFGRDPEPLRLVIEEAKELAEQRERGRNVTYVNDDRGDWRLVRIGNQRPVETVILPCGQLQDIVDDAKWFLGAQEWYLERGLPYRRGYLFHGSPGNGKSSMIQALATAYSLPIYALSITGEKLTDAQLSLALGQVPKRALLVLEDVDRVRLENLGVTLSGLLNAIDGALASEGRLLVMTANDPSKLDAALKRPGRLDRLWEFPKPDADVAHAMALRFFPGAEEPALLFAKEASSAGLSMAAIQGILAMSSTMEEASGRSVCRFKKAN